MDSKVWRCLIGFVMFLLVAAVTVLGAILIKGTIRSSEDPIRCYQCIAFSGDLPGSPREASDLYCEETKKLEKFLMECPFTMGKYKFTCANMTLKGTSNGAALSATIRTCLPHLTEGTACLSGTLREVASNEKLPEVANFLQNYLQVHNMSESTLVDACTCQSDMCNDGNYGNVNSKMLTILSAVAILSPYNYSIT